MWWGEEHKELQLLLNNSSAVSRNLSSPSHHLSLAVVLLVVLDHVAAENV